MLWFHKSGFVEVILFANSRFVKVILFAKLVLSEC